MITASSRDMHSVTNKVTQGAIQRVVQLANLKGTRRVYPKATTRVWRLAVRKSRRKRYERGLDRGLEDSRLRAKCKGFVASMKQLASKQYWK